MSTKAASIAGVLLLSTVLAAPVFAAASALSASPLSNIKSVTYDGAPAMPAAPVAAASKKASPSSTLARAGSPYERIFYYTPSAVAKKDFLAHLDQIDVFAPQTYAFSKSGDGTLTGSVDQVLLDAAAAHHIAVMPLVVNSQFGRAGIHALLDDTTAQTAALSDLVAEAKAHGYAGWQIDFEQIDASYRDKLSSFIKRFGIVMKGSGLVSSVAVVAQISNDPADYTGTLWNNVIGVYDYSAIGASVDFVSLMSYDDPDSKGSVARYTWLGKVLDFTLARIPAAKVSLGLGLYYWQWNEKTDKRIGIGGADGIATVLKKHRVTQKYDATEQAPYLSYVSGGVSYTVWFENWQSVAKKLALIKAKKLRGFSAWALGLEVTSVWDSIPKTK